MHIWKETVDICFYDCMHSIVAYLAIQSLDNVLGMHINYWHVYYASELPRAKPE